MPEAHPLKARLAQAGVTQRQAAALVGCTTRTLRNYLSQATPVPYYAKIRLERLCVAAELARAEEVRHG